MDVRIGIRQSPQVIEVEMDEDTDRDALKASVEAAIGAGSTLWLTNKQGKEVGIPADAISFFEIGSSDSRRIGFGA